MTGPVTFGSLLDGSRGGTPNDPFVEELLIKEARQKARSRRLRRGAITLVIAVIVLIASWAIGGGGGPHSHDSGLPRGRPVTAPTVGSDVTSTSLGAGTTVDAVDMLSSSFGYSLISNDTFHPSSRVFLAVTHSGGVRWSFVDALPRASYWTGGGEYIPPFHFTSRTTGYVTSALSTRVFVTIDAGSTWRSVSLPGTLSGWTFNASMMAAVSRGCPVSSSSARCPAFLSFLRDGAPTALRVAPVPLIPHLDTQTVVPLALTPTRQLIVMEGLQGGGGEHGSGVLLMTPDLGSTWQRLGDPCGIEAEGDQIIVLGSGRWLLSCFLGEGMMAGKSSIWRTSDSGHSWALVNRANDSSNNAGTVGNGGGVSMTVTPSGDGSLLFATTQGAVGGVSVSRDGGVHWSSAFLDGLGGAPETLSALGKRGALDAIDGGLIYRTTNGRTWTALPLLPAGNYQGLPICRAGHVTATLVPTHIKGIPGTYPVVFTNQGSNACYLQGVPIAQPVVGESTAPVGMPANRDVYSSARFVVLKAHGGTGSLWLSIDLGTASPSGYSTSVCRPRRVTAVSVRFSPPSTFLIALPRGRGDVCSTFPTTGVGFMIAGSRGLEQSAS